MQEALSVVAVIVFCVLAVLVVRLGLWIIGGRIDGSSSQNERRPR